MKAIARIAAMIRACEVRRTTGSAAIRPAITSALLADPRPELPDQQHDQGLEDVVGGADRSEEGAALGAREHPHRQLLDPQALKHGALHGLDLGELGRISLAEQ